MTQFPYPGIYVREVPSGVQAISGVSTSITAFVGMAKGGPLNLPTTILGIQDYERVFSADTSEGEMTEQVRQFFLNGGQRAIVTRVAHDARVAEADLVASDGTTTVLSLRSRDAGVLANRLRLVVDYNSSSPERFFNLTVEVEEFDASGTASVVDSETFENLSIAPSASRYVRTILDQQSRLVRANPDETATTTEETDAEGLATLRAFSASAGIFADSAAAQSAIDTAIQNTQSDGAGTTGAFRLRIEGPEASPTLTIVLSTGLTLAEIRDAINQALAPHTTVTVGITDPSNSPLRIDVVDPLHDIVIETATQFDIAAALGLGVAQGGIEVSAWANARPAPSGLVSVLDATPGDLAALLALGSANRTTLDAAGVSGSAAVRPFTVATGDIVFPGPGTLFQDGSLSTTPSLRNIVENLGALAAALSAGSPDWRAEVHGHRLALIPDFGSASSGAGAEFTSATPDLTGGGQIFDGVTGAAAGRPMTNGFDGEVAELDDYLEAFQQIEERVDIFNIMVLPKSADDTETPSVRAGVWGPASSFCRDQLAVILVDGETAERPQAVLDGLQPLRTGVATDHAATFWPRVRISSGGLTKTIDPSGSVAGVMARIDGARGVWKASAGVEANIFGVRGVDVPMSDAQNGLLNPQAVNAVRAFPNGVLVWGARTMAGFDGSGETDYRYLPVRRVALFIQASLQRGLRFALFEPNDEPLWAQIRLAVGTFMNGMFRDGAFAGETSDAAFFVKCDAETTTPADQALGVVRVLVGFAPLRPAEFVVLSLTQKTAQAQV